MQCTLTAAASAAKSGQTQNQPKAAGQHLPPEVSWRRDVKSQSTARRAEGRAPAAAAGEARGLGGESPGRRRAPRRRPSVTGGGRRVIAVLDGALLATRPAWRGEAVGPDQRRPRRAEARSSAGLLGGAGARRRRCPRLLGVPLAACARGGWARPHLVGAEALHALAEVAAARGGVLAQDVGHGVPPARPARRQEVLHGVAARVGRLLHGSQHLQHFRPRDALKAAAWAGLLALDRKSVV